MFGFSLRSFAEAAINSITGTSQSDEEIGKLVKEAESQDSSFANLLAIAKELEKQLLTFAETNSSILCHVEKLDDEANKNGESVDVWGKASRFYYCIDTVKESIFPDASEKLQSIRAEVGKRSETLHDLRGRESAFNTKQSAIADDEDLLKQLKSRDELISLHGDAHSDMVNQTREQMSKLQASIDADKAKQAEEKASLVNALNSLISSNRSFVEDSLHTLYDLFASTYAAMAATFSTEVPSAILDLKAPLIPGQEDKELRLTLSAGAIHEHPISVTKGSLVKWAFCCDDANVRFSVVLTTPSKEVVMVEAEHKVKGDGRFDLGEMVSDRDGVATLVWDNTYSLITPRQVHVRIAVRHPAQGVKSEEKGVASVEKSVEVAEDVKPVEEVKEEEVKKEEAKEEVKPAEAAEVKSAEEVKEEDVKEETVNDNSKEEKVETTQSTTEEKEEPNAKTD
ncbi:hypothetical protein WA556_000161 [Blastocystis sp. ATCC 50177/Nand II]